MRESKIEAYLVEQAVAAGGEVRKVKWVGRDSAPDRLLMLPPGGRVTPRVTRHPARTIWVEVKAEGLGATFPSNAHERAQHREHERMRAVGQDVRVIDSIAGVDALFA